jgi:flagellar biosynthesis protein FlhF
MTMMRTKVFAEDSREAMNKISREIGDDAVILSTKKVHGGIEIVVAHPKRENSRDPQEFPMDSKMRAFAQAKAQAQAFVEARVKAEKPSVDLEIGDEPTVAAKPAKPSYKTPVEPTFQFPAEKSQKAAEFDRLLNETARQFDRRVAGGARPPTLLTTPQSRQAPAAPASSVAHLSDADANRLKSLEESVNEIKSLLHSQMMMGGLKAAGASPALISVYLAQAGAIDEQHADKRFSRFLAKRLMHKEAPNFAEGPRVVVTLGPSGSGKTTLLSQIAARMRMAMPDEKITFVNADTSRLGASEQLRAHGRILDVPVIDIERTAELASLAESAGRRLSMFVDMPSDPAECAELLRVLENTHELAPLFRCGVVSSNLSLESLESMRERFPKLDAIALTKLDEARVTLPVLCDLSMHGPGVAFMSTNANLVRGLHEPDIDMLEKLISGSLPATEANMMGFGGRAA